MNPRFAMTLLVMLATPVFAGGGAMPLPLMDKIPPAKAQGKPPVPDMPASAAGMDQSVSIERFGKIISRVPLGIGGLTAWTVEKNGRRVVLYTTNDGQAIIAGVIWDAFSTKNISDQFSLNALPTIPTVKPPMGASTAPATIPAPQAVQNAANQGAALIGPYSGAIPESIQTIDSLAGVKEGKGGQADTLYIIVDPRCPYCRKAYQFTRAYVKRGFTIKWIPVVALGNPAQGTPIASTLVQAKPDQQADVLRRVLGDKEDVVTQPTKETVAALARNLDFFYAAFKNNQVEQAGVPAAFFLDKRTGKPRMMTGISEMPVIEEVFGKL